MFEVETSRSPQLSTYEASSVVTAETCLRRPTAQGKFLYVDGQKLWVRGVTYGTFRADSDGNEYQPDVVERDFALMAKYGLNALRTYTIPPRWLLDLAAQHALRVMIGCPWEQHIAFLDDKQTVRSIAQRLRKGVRGCAGHPAVLCYAIGNEIPAPIVRWHGPKAVERFLERLYGIAKTEDPEGLVTYVNYPTTEYLQLPFLDLFCFNVYLESRERLEAYLARLHHHTYERPLIMSEVGLDSRRHGADTQAQVLEWQVHTTFASGCAGAFVFAWTDEWHRGGHDIDEWDFGLTDRDRHPKPALKAVSTAFADIPFPSDMPWPRMSVVVCSYNGEWTIRECLEGLQRLQYPDFEVIVVDDGSTDNTAAIAQEYDVKLISTVNRGLSKARNTGFAAATGEIVAYIDDDAYPDPHWLTYLAATFANTRHVGVGGPNIAPPGDGFAADCVANAPGGPVHVLLSDQEAEHIPGCNMAFRKTALQDVGGFDSQFRIAGDDVDICWRLQQRGGTLGFSPAALVWHHRRNSIRAYWKQQRGYGRAEAMLEKKWPEKYNHAGHLTWVGRVYGKGLTHILGGVRRIYHGVWGSAPFQSLYQPAPNVLQALPLIPEWYLLIGALALFSLCGVLWAPLFWAFPGLLLAVAASGVQASLSAAEASFTTPDASGVDRGKLYALTTCLYVLQPAARLWGRISYGLTPWRRYGIPSFAIPRPRLSTIRSASWRAPEQRLEALETALRTQGVLTVRGSDYDRWDLELRGGAGGSVRVRMAVEEHGAGQQFVRLRSWPRCSGSRLTLGLLLAALTVAAALDGALAASMVLGMGWVLLTLHTFLDCAAATAAYLHALKHPQIRPMCEATRCAYSLYVNDNA